MQREITKILDSGKFSLRKRCSNSPSILKRIENSSDDKLFILELGEGDIVKSLGLCWEPIADVFLFNIMSSEIKAKITKRIFYPH